MDEAVKLASESIKQSADTVERDITEMIVLNNNQSKKAGEDATKIYNQSTLIVGGFILFSTCAAIALAFIYTRRLTRPISQSLAIAERIAKNDLTASLASHATRSSKYAFLDIRLFESAGIDFRGNALGHRRRE